MTKGEELANALRDASRDTVGRKAEKWYAAEEEARQAVVEAINGYRRQALYWKCQHMWEYGDCPNYECGFGGTSNGGEDEICDLVRMEVDDD
ncbi:MAG: hypothetical protein FWD72_01740 [Eggerthellaceae bacterium]|nr:hypothetical protein [Eggerthellaceae bacterium]